MFEYLQTKISPRKAKCFNTPRPNYVPGGKMFQYLHIVYCCQDNIGISVGWPFVVKSTSHAFKTICVTLKQT